jgi:hypothetical protein
MVIADRSLQADVLANRVGIQDLDPTFGVDAALLPAGQWSLGLVRQASVESHGAVLEPVDKPPLPSAITGEHIGGQPELQPVRRVQQRRLIGERQDGATGPNGSS